MRWVLITPFGQPVEPEVKRNLAIVSGPVFGMRGLDRASVGQEIGTRGGRLGQRIARDHQLGIGRHHRCDGARERLAVRSRRRARA